jgi:exopolysaccharide biosynthesis polyprenyl glycosylphosphotransferase
MSVLMIVAASTVLAGCYAGIPPVDLGALSAVCLVAAAAPMRAICVGMRQRRLLARRIVILGSGPLATKLLEEIESLDHRCEPVAGVIDDQPLPDSWTGRAKWLGPSSRLAEVVARERPARIVVAVADRRDRLPLPLLLELRVRGIIVEDALEFYERLTGKIAIEALNPSALILSSKGFRNHGAAEVMARIVSLIVATIGLVLTAPLLAIIAVAIKLDSRGPVLFVQKRAGRNGRPFGLLKFRTMHPSEERSSEWVTDNAHRITGVGLWLRRCRLDELPQLINVLKGEMNLVGPRPHPTCNHQTFTERIAYYGIRSTVRPGVTGWAQVRYGYANNLDEETEKMRYDLFYIKNRSLALDTRILVETILVMLSGEGASRVRRQPRPQPSYAPWLVRTGASPSASRD